MNVLDEMSINSRGMNVLGSKCHLGMNVFDENVN